jgi:hypothetical protein
MACGANAQRAGSQAVTVWGVCVSSTPRTAGFAISRLTSVRCANWRAQCQVALDRDHVDEIEGLIGDRLRIQPGAQRRLRPGGVGGQRPVERGAAGRCVAAHRAQGRLGVKLIFQDNQEGDRVRRSAPVASGDAG